MRWRRATRWVALVVGGALLGTVLGWLEAARTLGQIDARLVAKGEHVCGAAVAAFTLGFSAIGALAGAVCGAASPFVVRIFRRVRAKAVHAPSRT